MRPDECDERIRLIDSYSHAVTEFNTRLEIWKAAGADAKVGTWKTAEIARGGSETAWRAVADHIEQHRCSEAEARPVGNILGQAADAAFDAILVANDDRCLVEANQAAADIFGLPSSAIIGRRIEEFFTNVQGEPVHTAWKHFVDAGTQSGICLSIAAPERRFEYRAKANFLPGLHFSVLRELKD